jgi:hypothetical protein
VNGLAAVVDVLVVLESTASGLERLLCLSHQAPKAFNSVRVARAEGRHKHQMTPVILFQRIQVSGK